MHHKIREILLEVKAGQLSSVEATILIRALRQNEGAPSEISKRYEYDMEILKDHRLFETQILMGMVYCALAIDAATSYLGGTPIGGLKKVSFLNPIPLHPGERVDIKVTIEEDNGRLLFKTWCQTLTNPNIPTATGEILYETLHDTGRLSAENINIDAYKNQNVIHLSADDFYQQQNAYGPALRTLREAFKNGDELLARYELRPPMLAETNDYLIHPAILDAAYASSLFLIGHEKLGDCTWVPLYIHELSIKHPPNTAGYCLSKLARLSPEIIVTDNLLFTSAGVLGLEIKGLSIKRVASKEAFNMGGSSPARAAPRSQAKIADKATAPASSAVDAPNLKDAITQYIVTKLNEALNSPNKALARDKSFMDLGLDSSDLISISPKIEAQIGIELYPTLFFENENINALAHYFLMEHKGQFAAYFAGDSSIAPLADNAEPEEAVKSRDYPDFQAGETTRHEDHQQRNIKSQLDSSSWGEENIKLGNDIAIIGMAARLPSSSDLEEFWGHLHSGSDLIQEIPLDHWDYRPWFSSDRQADNKTYSKWGSFLTDVDKFDAAFFQIAPKEAVWLDPQLRLLLEVMYAAMEDAGYAGRLSGSRSSVYVGSCFHEYWDELIRAKTPLVDYQHSSGAMSSLSGRLSYTFDLQGASLPLDNACASSLTAMHLASASLAAGESDLAFVAGANLLLSPLHYVYFSRIQALSPTGRCHSFDAAADGYVPGEGVVVFVLKPLAKAIADRDNIHAVIKGIATNHVGRANNPTAPRPELQTKLLIDAWQKAGINPETISYIEAHGTGTALGDPIEVGALKKAFANFTDKKAFCWLGSAKSHLGHLEAAAGISSVLKVILSMKAGQIPAMPQFKKLSPYIKLEDSPFMINTLPVPWERKAGIPRRAGISSFGMTGNNAHVVIEEYLAPSFDQDLSQEHEALFVLSARKDENLRAYAQKFLIYLKLSVDGVTAQGRALANLCYTLQKGRQVMEKRLGIVATSLPDLEEKLERFLNGETNIAGVYYGQQDEEKGERLHYLARLWVKNGSNDWEELYKAPALRIISLPTYPFEKKRYWFPTSNTSGEAAAKKTPEASASSQEAPIYFTTDWQKDSTSPATFFDPSNTGSVIIFALNDSWSKRWSQIAPGYRTILVTPGASFREEAPHHFSVKAADEEAIQRLAAASVDFALQGELKVLYLWGDTETPALENLAYHFDLGIITLAVFTKALMGMKAIRRVDLVSLAPLPLDTGLLQRAAMGGFHRSVHLENPNFYYRSLFAADLDLVSLTTVLRDELLGIYSYEPEIYWQKNQRHLRRFLELPPPTEGPDLFRENGFYLITGGLGGIGYLIATHLAHHYRARLLLSGRRTLGASENEQLARLSALGGRPLYYAADLSQPDDVNELINYGRNEFGHIDGVIHSAGLIRDSFLISKVIDDFRTVIAPKTIGTLYLDHATRDEPLDFFMLFSSLAGITGNYGQSDYAFANHFLANFSEHRNTMQSGGLRSGKTIAIAWPLWADGGMQVSEKVKTFIEREAGMQPFATKDGLDTLRNALSLSFSSQFAVVSGISDKIRTFFKLQTLSKSAGQDSAPIGTSELRYFLRTRLATALGASADDIDEGTDATTYGIDSISLVRFIDDVNLGLGVQLSPAIFYGYPTIDKFADYLLQEHGAEMKNGLANTAASSAVLSGPPSREDNKTDDVAIIGIAGLMPAADDLEAFWHNLISGKDAISEVPAERWNWKEFWGDPTREDNKTHASSGGFAKGMDKFDYHFFGISRGEAELMDPQQRVFLQVAWQAIENSGHSPEEFSGSKTGVFVGVHLSEYSQLLHQHLATPEAYIATGNSHAVIANRLSFLLNLRGPSEAIDSACSSSLVAIHRAVESLRSGSSDLAIAGGVNTLFTPQVPITLSRAGMLSTSGRCRTFDKDADGYVRSEGAGAVVLKPLAAARRDGDYIYGVIKGSAENHGGHTNSLTSPSPVAQAELIIDAVRRSGVDAAAISYIETHGTGTQLGDPVEIEGLKLAFSRLAAEGLLSRTHPGCLLGAVKSNIGHLETAAGIAGLFKLLLALQHGEIPANLHFVSLNPYIDLTGTPFKIIDQNTPWLPVPGVRRTAGISSFGFGGTNAHLIIEEEPLAAHDGLESAPCLFLLSATDKERLLAYSVLIRDYLAAHPELMLDEIAYTLQVGRNALSARLAIIAGNKAELNAALSAFIAGRSLAGLYHNNAGERAPNMIDDLDKVTSTAAQNAGDEIPLIDLFAAHDLKQLATRWLEGAKIEWRKLYQSAHPKRVPLPGYPFAPLRVWFCESPPPASSINNAVTSTAAIGTSDKPLPASDATHELALLAASILKIAPTSIDKNRQLTDYGFDSISLIDFTRRINKTFDTELVPSVFFEHKTLHQISSYLSDRCQKSRELIRRDGRRPVTPKAHVKVGHSSASRNSQDIAIIGMAGHLPGATDLANFFDNLLNSKDAIGEVPQSRWSISDHPELKWGGFIDNAHNFDSLLFGISPREARLMDPQHRLFLQTVYAAIEDAGYAPTALRGSSTAVFAGISTNDYIEILRESGVKIEGYTATGNSHAMLTNRISYMLDLKGPSAPIDTACSSSLVAVHRAIKTILAGDATLAIAGGVNLILTASASLALQRAGMLSVDGHCKSFDASADGYVRSEGVGAILLKPLVAAERDGDAIYAIIKASTENHAGRASSLTAPSPVAQAALISDAIRRSGIDPKTITYIETHGTGTALGDPVEIDGLKKAFCELLGEAAISPQPWCALGSVKSNIGHLETAAGIAGLIKTVLAIKQGEIPPLLHFKYLNPYIDLTNSPFYIADKRLAWVRLQDANDQEIPRRAGVSSFGFGGSNAHIILEEYRSQEDPSPLPDDHELYLLSAASRESLTRRVTSLLSWLTSSAGQSAALANIAYTLAVGRDGLDYRLAVIASSKSELISKLDRYKQNDLNVEGLFTGQRPAVAGVIAILSEEAEGQQFFQRLFASGKLATLAQLWCSGVNFDFDLARFQTGHRRLHLPTYPFAQVRHWPTVSEQRLPESHFAARLRYFEPLEQKTAPVSVPVNSEHKRRIALFNGKTSLADALRSSSGELISIALGEKFTRTGPATFIINPCQLEDYECLFTEIATTSATLLIWIADDDADPISASQNLFTFCRYLLSTNKSSPFSVLYIYTNDLSLPSTRFNSASAVISRSLRQIASRLKFKSIGLTKVDASSAPLILSETHDFTPSEVIYNRDGRHCLLDVEILLNNRETPVRVNGVYLITGGSGALGLIFAEHLLRRYEAKIALLGRSAMTPALHEALARLKTLGGEVAYFTADVTDQDSVMDAVKNIRAVFGPIEGVLHAAGRQSKTLLSEKNEEEFLAILAPKVQGVELIDAATASEPLRFFVLFSSSAARLGDFGQADYAIGNRYLDLFAAHRNRLVSQKERHGKTVAINWPLWQAGGMHAGSEAEKLYLKSASLAYLEIADGLAAFDNILASDATQIMLQVPTTTPAKKAPCHGENGETKSISSSLTDEPPIDATKAIIEENIRALASTLIEIDPGRFDPQENLGIYGFDSLTLKEFAQLLSEKYKLDISPSLFYAKANIAEVRDYLFEEVAKNSAQLPLSDQLPSASHSSRAPEVTTKGKVAIIGMAGIFPGAKDLDGFWQRLLACDDLVTEVPLDRWNWQDHTGDHIPHHRRSSSKWGAFIDDVDRFDARFFNIPPLEAQMMDPQHRLLLQTVWKAIEDGGHRASDIDGKAVGVFMGVQFNDYYTLIKRTDISNAQISTGNSHALLSNRISYFFNLHGPSESIDTACSSSLVALHRAVKSIQNGESTFAIAGGVSLMLTAENMITVSQMGMLATDGKCKTFDEKANGYVKGEGIAALFLKPLEAALQDGNPIHAVIGGTAENHGGRAHSLTAPNVEAQAAVILKAFNEAEVNPAQIGFIETHGTGTELGDPVEIDGLKAAFSTYCQSQSLPLPLGTCGLGALKTNIGHLEPASGVAGVIKAVFALKEGKLPGLVHFSKANPYIKISDSPFYLLDKTATWPSPLGARGEALPRVAGVSSFGYGGVNAHVVLEEFVATESDIAACGEWDKETIILLSAKRSEELKSYAGALLAYLESKSISLASLAITLWAARQPMSNRLAIVTSSVSHLKMSLQRLLTSRDEILGVYTTDFTDAAYSPAALHEMAIRWVKGDDNAIKIFATSQNCRRIHAPTYPFAKDRYWITDDKNLNRAGGNGKNCTLFFEKLWRLHPLTSNATASPALRDVLLFGNDSQLAASLTAKLQEPSRLIRIKTGGAFSREHEKLYTIDPHNRDDYRKLFHALKADACSANNIFYGMEQSPRPLTYLFQEFEKAFSGERLRLIAYYWREADFISLKKAAISGFIRCVNIENNKYRLSQLLLNVPRESPQGTIAAKMLEELTQTEALHPIVMLDPNERWVEALSEVTLAESQEPSRLRMQGTYVITGATGGLGTSFARDLARRYKANLILAARSAVISADFLKELEGLGGRAIYICADISNKEQVDQLISQGKAAFGPIHGIIHAAGVIHDGLLLNKRSHEIDQVLAPKVEGTFNLDLATKKEPLDFFVLFSSTAATLGSMGQSDYGYANAFMDHFSLKREKLRETQLRSGKTLAINWPLWQEGGMQVEKEVLHMLEATTGMRPLSSKHGLEIFYRALHHNLTPIVVIHGNRDRITKLIANVNQSASPTPSAALTQKRDQGERFNLIWHEVSVMLNQLAHLEPRLPMPDLPFSDYGLSSLMLIELANQVNARYDLTITPADFYEHRSLGDFCRAILLKYPNKVIANPELDYESPPATQQSSSPPPFVTCNTACEPIAIVGMAGMMPGGKNLDDFWRSLVRGDDLISEIPEDRWDWRRYYGDPARQAGRTFAKWGGFVTDMDKFDYGFFGITPKEARLMDPQQRIVLQTVWRTIEDAGYKPSALAASSTGVFVGVQSSDYVQLLLKHSDEVEAYATTGNAHSIIANRVSYFFDLHGPSEAIDTACSSALVAINRAIESIRSNNCTMAIAGGVNAIFTPELPISLSRAGMLSPDGRCKTFDASANGYVRSEGIGMVLLKPLARALLDRDDIYAVILAARENHGGHSASLTSPSPRAQADLIRATIKAAGISPTTISYIETHGTGTALGDPIEVNGLKIAFDEALAERGEKPLANNWCAIGSVKTNVGHLESAAGMASLFKVILGMRHRLIPGMLHLRKQNPYIDLTNSPFYISDKTQVWEEPVANQKQPHPPRRAGISSFGFGGSNAHLIIEEYKNEPQEYFEETISQGAAVPEVILLSAKDDGALRRTAKNLSAFLERQTNEDRTRDETPDTIWLNRLRDILAEIISVNPLEIDSDETLQNLGLDPTQLARYAAMVEKLPLVSEFLPLLVEYQTLTAQARYLASLYEPPASARKPDKEPPLSLGRLTSSLQHGREEFPVRLAIIATNIKELKTRLRLFLAKKPDPYTYTGIAAATSDHTPLSASTHEPAAIAAAWCRGVAITWHERKETRLHLPSYPFCDQRVWFKEDASGRDKDKARVGLAARFTRSDLGNYHDLTLTHNDLFLRDHVVNGVFTLPAAAYLELVSTLIEETQSGAYELKELLLRNPAILVGSQLSLKIAALPDGSITIHSGDDLSFIGKWLPQNKTLLPTSTIDIQAIEKRCKRKIDAQTIYPHFAKIGFTYGRSLQVITTIHVGANEVLAALEISPDMYDELQTRPYYAGLLDGAFQSVAPLVDSAYQNQLFLPFSIGQVIPLHPLTRQVCVHIRRRPVTSETLQKFDLTITDNTGQPLVLVNDFVIKLIQTPHFLKDISPINQDNKSTSESIFYKERWLHSRALKTPASPACILIFDKNRELDLLFTRHFPDCRVVLVITGDSFEEEAPDSYTVDPKITTHYSRLFTALNRKRLKPDLIVFRWGNELNSKASISEKLALGVHPLFLIAKAYNQRPSESKSLTLFAITTFGKGDLRPERSAVSALFKSFYQENPKLRFRSLEVERHASTDSAKEVLGKAILSELSYLADLAFEVRYIRNTRYIRRLVEQKVTERGGRSSFKRHGTYLITGGLGGIGRIISRFLATNYAANLVLIGRRPSDATSEKELAILRKSGSDAIYFAADITEASAFESVLKQAKKRFLKLNGIIHTAGVLKDASLNKKSLTEFSQVLAPKLLGTFLIDLLTKNEELDLFINFSSTSASLGNRGQSDYSYANRYLEHFTVWRESERRRGTRHGRTLSINWPLWADGGMQVDAATLKMLELSFGLLPLPTTSAIEALLAALAISEPNLMLLFGLRRRIESALKLEGNESEPKLTATEELCLPAAPSEPDNHVKPTLRKLLAQVVGVEVDEISEYDELQQLGIDSIGTIDLINRVNQELQLNLAPLDAIEHSSISKLARHILNGQKTEVTSETMVTHRLTNAAKPSYELFSQRFTAGGMTLNYLEKGPGVPILFIPGIGMTSRAYYYQLLNLAHSYRVIAIDMPGHGFSTSIKRVDLPELADLFMTLMHEIAPGARFNLIAHSFGGLIAQIMAATYPEHIDSLILINGFTTIRSDGELATISRFSKLTDDDFAKSLLYKDLTTSRDELKATFKNSLNIDMASGLAYWQAIARGLDTAGYLPGIKAPTLILSGSKDTVTPKAESAALKKAIATARFCSIDNGGHFPFITHYEEVNTEILKFLQFLSSKKDRKHPK